jgi:hypothetical protein
MKKSLQLIPLIALMLVFACKKDKDTDPFKASYTTETVEQSKTNVEQNAIDLVDQLDALSSAKGLQVIMHLANLNPVVAEKSAMSNPVLQPLSLISSLNNKTNAAKVFKGMRSNSLMTSDPVAISALFDSIAGKYTYNFNTQAFDRTELANQIVFEFPGLETDLTNTAVITVDNFTVATITNPGDNWPSGLANEAPTGLRLDLKYNGTSVAGFTFGASYQSDGMPTRVNMEMYVDDFRWTLTAVHSPYTSASFTNTLKYKSDILFETYIAAEGNWSQDNIDNSTVETDYGTDTQIEEIINNANAHVILMNLEVVGRVNIKPLGDTLWAVDARRDQMTKEEIAQAQVDAINANGKLIVIYRDSNLKVAEAEAYVASSFDDYTQETDYYPAMRFVYADGSNVDVNTYVNNELDNFYTSLNQFIDTLNFDYGLNINHVNGTPTK